VICKLTLTLLSFGTVTQWRTVMVQRLFFHRFYWIIPDIRVVVFFMSVHFPSLYLYQISFSNLCLYRKIQATAHIYYFIQDSDQIPLYFLLNFSLGNLTVAPIYCCALLQILNEFHGQEILWLEKNCESRSDKLHVALYNLTATWV